ncbi:MAG TPA: EAL domain-containing protein [Burkholderiales bacterium]|nr:EAL domain-containing protein [Burkholderiales bacterium]
MSESNQQRPPVEHAPLERSKVQIKVSHLLAFIISLMWVLVFFATLAVVVSSTRDYLQRAMESHAQDTATSLGLSITHSAKSNDVATIDTMANAIFDRGYYREILVKRSNGEVLVAKRLEEAVEGVPGWFIKAFPLKTPRMDATVMDGWRQVAVVEVVSHAGHAYSELWRVSVRSAWVLFIVAIVSLVLVLVIMGRALRPLRDMEQQAINIAKREFTTLKKLPWARELHRITFALNSMVVAVERMLTEQSELAEKMRQKAYVDEVTGLMNRSDFSERLRHLIGAPTKFASGALVIIRIRGFAAYNERNGRVAGDGLLAQTATILNRFAARDERSLLARLDGPEFALLVPDIAEAAVPALGDELVKELGEIEEFPHTETSIMAHVGIAYYRYSEDASFGKVMAAANAALATAQARDAPAWHVQEADATGKSSALYLEISGMFQVGLSPDRVALQYQTVKPCVGEEAAWRYRTEACVRIVGTDGSMIRAGLFIAAAKRLGALRLLDQIVIDKVMQHVQIHGPVQGGPTAVNLSMESIVDPEFVTWLVAKLRAQPDIARNLILEVAENAISSKIQDIKPIFARLRETGVRMSIDRFGQSAASLGYLRSLVVDYIKIDGSFTPDILTSTDRQFFVQALVGIAHGLGIQVIMEWVENERQFDMVKSLGVDGAQGYYIGKPE